jgi:hypothetical protein
MKYEIDGRTGGSLIQNCLIESFLVQVIVFPDDLQSPTVR